MTLRSDGLGIVAFGEPAESAAALLIDRLGPPSSDSSYTPPGPEGVGCFVATGYGCEEYFRSLSWEDLGLSVVLIDVSPYRNDGAPHFAGWSHWENAASSRLRTREGIGIGAPVADLRAAYGDQLELSPWLDPCDIEETWEFRLEVGIVGSLSGPPDVTTTSVSDLHAGVSSSC
jgi:hypothetical protein